MGDFFFTNVRLIDPASGLDQPGQLLVQGSLVADFGPDLGRPDVPDPAALEGLGERWRPHRSTAARLLWHGYLGRRARVETPGDLLDDLV